ncbi:putative membrane protein [Wickerhamomyces ciferrii]|uniref:Membrane protein n=1 Tax=Wickerhamomyces ciferrii (strain ATCC 14091 / BCRC 22168 / CBS 111 / JCM 3599 / NBRC 0793 / NRRL Y-1031 F-60-10) TaxID=1206466 RepID=K0KSF4_WICCF|nr:uncharacterized protein BN7_5689 [Wickerhamomyces ciferrii]CCH46101.1 putative membrane protein [Wickerhamomyces ciferrii]
MVSEDFFLQYRPFITDPKNYYEAHYHEIIGSAVFYQLLFTISPIISRSLFGENYNVLSKKGKKNFDIHIVSMVQCLISIGVIFPLYGNETLNKDPIFSYLPYAGFVSAITIGYFIWDLFICLRYFKMFGVGFLLHAFASLFVFSSTLRPFCLSWVAGFLSFELSTPFVNINWFISKLPNGTVPFQVQAINGLLLMITFFVVRIIWGFYAIFKVSIQFYQVWDKLPIWLPLSIVGLNFALDVLNVYWFKKMVSIAIKKFSAPPASTSKKDE